MKNALSLLSFIFWLSLSLESYGQDDLKFEHLTTEQGLSHNSVWSICQDREGFMWFGTLDGLNRYDGYTFKVFRADPRDPEHTLQHNIISDIHEDRAGRLWVATLGGGLHEVDKRTGNVTPYRIDPKHVNLWNILVSIYEDHQGILWLGAGKGIARFDPRTKQYTLYPNPAQLTTAYVNEDTIGQFWATDRRNVLRLDSQTGQYTTFPMNHLNYSFVLPFHIAPDGMAWVGTAGSGLFRMDTRQPGQFIPYQPSSSTINKSISLNGLYESGRYLWIGTSEGLQRIDKQTAQVVTYQANPELPYRLTENTVQAIYQDRSGTLWVGTTLGLNKVTAHSKPFNAYQLLPTLPGIRRNANNISAVLEDYTGMLWVSSAGDDFVQGVFQNGLFRYDTKRKQAKRVLANTDNSKALSSENVLAIHEARNGQLWVGTAEGLNRFDRARGTFTRYPSRMLVKSITEDPSGTLWVAGPRRPSTSSGGIASFNPTTGQYVNYVVDPKNQNGLTDNNIEAVFASRTGHVYIATGGDGVNWLDPKTGKFTKYLPNYVSPEGHLNDKEVHTFYEDQNGIIWLGTRLGGLHRFDPKTERFTYFTTQDGLANNSVNSIIGDNSGNLWIGTDQGLSRFNPRTKRFHNYDISDGLPDNGFRQGSVSKRENKLVFGTVNGFVEFYPDSIRDNTTPPPVYINGFSVLGKSRPLPTGTIELPYNENFLSFEFVALNYNAPEKNQYAYQLIGVDKDWVYSGNRRLAAYTQLQPGEYTFRVKASNNDGIWNEKGTAIEIVIHSPWWRTWWMYSFYGLCLLAISLAVNRVLRQRLIEAERAKTRERELAQAHEIEKAYHQLQQTQTQLIQKEKMASLGELTAGIAHEIQNPLNFVNNFSEVSAELVSELEEEHQKPDRDSELEAEILGDLKQNLQKITHHGSRASSIVKGMLEHARTSTGERQPTDLNALTDEYLRLAYQGLRAKDKTFNCELATYFDPALGKAEVVPQEIGRVLLNLFNNAFYAVSQKQKQSPDRYKPTVSISTKRTDKQSDRRAVEIRVKDNGVGIPESVIAKIFQPFFTTKPTGEGTGLGLSLSYDIVTKGHEGTIWVESAEGQGTEFIIQLPIA